MVRIIGNQTTDGVRNVAQQQLIGFFVDGERFQQRLPKIDAAPFDSGRKCRRHL
jgi:hypothetical protein